MKKILTIDGGGMRGILAAAIVEEMERVAGAPAVEIFDCFMGTSAGSILAAGLAMGKSARFMREQFEKLHDLPEKMALQDGSATAPMKTILQGIFGDTRPADLKKPFAAPAKNAKHGRVYFFGNFPADTSDTPSFWDNKANLDEGGLPVWKVVLRSAALPPFFKPVDDYIDGGISPFSNPTYAAFVGSERRLGWGNEQRNFYSVGTGYHTGTLDLSGNYAEHLGGFMLLSMMQDANFLQHQIMKTLRDDKLVNYKRYNIHFSEQAFSTLDIKLPSGITFEDLLHPYSTKLKEMGDVGDQVAAKLVKASDF